MTTPEAPKPLSQTSATDTESKWYTLGRFTPEPGSTDFADHQLALAVRYQEAADAEQDKGRENDRYHWSITPDRASIAADVQINDGGLDSSGFKIVHLQASNPLQRGLISATQVQIEDPNHAEVTVHRVIIKLTRDFGDPEFRSPQYVVWADIFGADREQVNGFIDKLTAEIKTTGRLHETDSVVAALERISHEQDTPGVRLPLIYLYSEDDFPSPYTEQQLRLYLEQGALPTTIGHRELDSYLQRGMIPVSPQADAAIVRWFAENTTQLTHQDLILDHRQLLGQHFGIYFGSEAPRQDDLLAALSKVWSDADPTLKESLREGCSHCLDIQLGQYDPAFLSKYISFGREQGLLNEQEARSWEQDYRSLEKWEAASAGWRAVMSTWNRASMAIVDGWNRIFG